MLYQELPRIDSTALDGWARWLVPALVVAAGATAALLLLLIGQPLFAGACLLAGLVGAALVLLRARSEVASPEPLVVGPDYSLLGSALGLSREPTALTTGAGSLLIVNAAFRERFGRALQTERLNSNASTNVTEEGSGMIAASPAIPLTPCAPMKVASPVAGLMV